MSEELKRIQQDELRKIQIEILDVVSAFCEKNNIHYWVDCGTLLGAIRHKGYIPWDDDIDIGMLRSDYDRFMRLFNEQNERYKFYSIENNKKFLYPHGKVIDTSTILYEPNKKGNKLAINIDVFVYDNAPNSNKFVEKMYKRCDRYLDLNWLRTRTHNPKGNIFRRSIIYLTGFCLKIFPKNFFVKEIIKNSKRYVNEDTKYIGNFTAWSRIYCPKEIFRDFIDVEFEGKCYKAPIGYHEWLTAFYGDYMQLPPEEKQVSHHMFEAYYKD